MISAAKFVKSIALSSGAKIPVLGLGVYESGPGAETYDAVRTALQLGYRHIDSAKAYRNEGDVGRAIRDSGIPREDIFVTSKIVMRGKWSYDDTIAAVGESLAKFEFSYVDLYLLHAPFAPEGRADAWKALEDLQTQGLLKDIGVSNFSEAHLAKLATTWRVVPAVNQFELHPFYTRTALVKACSALGIQVQAYCPLTRGLKLGDPTLVSIANQVQATPAQVLLAWGIGKGYIVLPKSVHAARIEENLNAAKIELSAEQLAQLDALDDDINIAGWNPVRDHAV